MKETPTLKSKRLTLRKFRSSDADSLYRWASSLSNAKYLYWHPHRDIEVSKRLLDNWLRKKRNYSWALDDGTEAIGEVQVIKDLPEHGFELGYILLEEKQGQGYMKEALQTVLDYLFLRDGYLYSKEEVNSLNVASRKTLESLGYKFLEEEKNVYIAKIESYIDRCYYTLSKEEYLKHKEQGQNPSIEQKGQQTLNLGAK
ncbi:MAG: GNAT family N-acetyltransferase [Bacilli bacterium]|jgi:ribosomal-protein-alanine N-acetyltransferase|nr:GNAT family N-acetyltransferase [Bacilli bacterium]